jgi:hypothetical protein
VTFLIVNYFKMINNIPEYLRRLSIEALFQTQTIINSWPTWKSRIDEILGDEITENSILNLGDSLSDIFQSTGGEGRDQGALSGGGNAWEALVCYYINLCSIGSRTVAIRKMSLVPSPIQSAITVNYGNFACNTESDITVIVFPDEEKYNTDINLLPSLRINDIDTASIKRGKLDYEYLNHIVSESFENFEIGVIQCKTNWNDNAQIPMLWDMIYSANGFRGRNITIGKDGYNIHQANNFTYSFVTVPSNRRANYNSDSVAVRRVTNLSGGNYWGKPTQENVARSLKEIFTNNFQSGATNSLRQDIRNSIEYLNTDLSYFRLT